MVTHRDECVQRFRHLGGAGDGITECLRTRGRRVAMLGGFLARKGDGEPGVKTLWIGLQRVMDFAAGVRFMRDSGDGVSCVSWNGFDGR